VRPDGAGADEVDGPDPDFGAALGAVEEGLGAGRVVVVVDRRAATVVAERTGALRAVGRVVGAIVNAVVDGAAAARSAVSERLTRLSADRAAATSVVPPADTDTAAARCGGEDEGGGAACSNASAGIPAMAAHNTRGMNRRARLGPRVVRTLSFLQNAGAARPPLHDLKRSQRRLRKT
jgi:hypothetical protein